ncbi:MAG: zinc dependent phospholipase C family protein [archaeon]
MELIGHLLLTGALFGFSLFLLFGVIAPDFLYVLAYLHKKNKRIHLLGEYLHSIFLAPLIVLAALIIHSNHMMLFGYGYGTHIITDLFVHREEGSRYLYPFTKRKIKSGPFYWKNKKFIIITYFILIALLIIRYRL